MKHREPADPSATTDAPAAQEDFLHRWSRRKAAARQQAAREQAAPAATPVAQAGTAEPAHGADAPEPPPLTDADMPPLETLTEQSDVSGFFSPGVSEELRRMALRRVFSLARYNVRDGLNDYDEDYTNFAPLGDTVTADMKHQLELRAERERAAQAERERLATARGETPQAGSDEPAREHDADVPTQANAAGEPAAAATPPSGDGSAPTAQRDDGTNEVARGGAAAARDDGDGDVG